MLDRGAIESARRALHVLHQVLDYGCALGLLHQNSATPLKSTLPHSTPKHYGAPTTPKDYHEVTRLLGVNYKVVAEGSMRQFRATCIDL